MALSPTRAASSSTAAEGGGADEEGGDVVFQLRGLAQLMPPELRRAYGRANMSQPELNTLDIHVGDPLAPLRGVRHAPSRLYATVPYAGAQ